MGKISDLGMFAILVKVGPQLFPLLSKLGKIILKTLKGLIGVKAVGAGASLGLYSLLFSWQMGVSIVLFILIHEYGHFWAMKRCGIKTKGIYLIPGFGGAAIVNESFKSGRNEAFISIMGPLFGIFFIFPVIGLYFVTKNPMYAAIASLTSLFNLINLFPINPLDGGRIVKSLLYSFGDSRGFLFTMLSFFLAFFASFFTGYYLLALIAMMGLGEILDEYKLKESLVNFLRTAYRGIGLVGALIAFQLFNMSNSWWERCLFGLVIVVLGLLFMSDVRKNTVEQGKPFFMYPLVLINQLFAGIVELFSISPSNLKRIENYEKMDKAGTSTYTMIYLITILAMIFLVLYTGNIPGCQHMKEILM